MTFTWSTRRFVLVAVLLGVVSSLGAWLMVALIFSAFSGRVVLPSATVFIVYAASYSFFYAVFSLLRARRRPAELSFGSEGVKLAAAGSDAVIVPYAAVAEARVRGWWILAALQVFVPEAEAQRVTFVDREGRRVRGKRRSGRLRFGMPVAGLNAPPSAIRAEVTRRFDPDRAPV